MSIHELYLIKTPYVFTGISVDPHKTPFTLIGIPLDSSSSFRAGSRFAPAKVRQVSSSLELYCLSVDVDFEKVLVHDAGDIAVVHGDIETSLRRIECVISELVKHRKLLIIGGEHIITYGAIRGIERNTKVIILDAHADMRYEYLGFKLSHACTIRRIVETIGIDNVMLIGPRAFSSEELEFIRKNGVKLITTYAIRSLGMREVVRRIDDFLEDAKNIYISIDMDVFDPAYAPGVQTPEPDGLAPWQVFTLLMRILSERVSIVDVVEVTPPYDSSDITSFLAAKLLIEAACKIYKSLKAKE